jgi:hypothetical protein
MAAQRWLEVFGYFADEDEGALDVAGINGRSEEERGV